MWSNDNDHISLPSQGNGRKGKCEKNTYKFLEGKPESLNLGVGEREGWEVIFLFIWQKPHPYTQIQCFGLWRGINNK